MADEEKQQGGAAEAAEAVKSSGKNFLKLLTWIIPAFILGYVLYMLFIGSDPRRQYDNPRETLEAYTQIVGDFQDPAPIWPDKYMIDRTLGFYDQDTRDWFEANKRSMARMRTQSEAGNFGELSDDGIRAAALLYLVNIAPMNGVAEIITSRNPTPARAEMQVVSRDLQPRNLVMEEKSAIWLITDVGGIKESLTQQIQQFERNNPENTETP